MKRANSEGDKNRQTMILRQKLKEAKEEAEKRRNFFTFKDIEGDQALMFPLDGEFVEEEKKGFIFTVYRPSIAVLLNQVTGEVISVKRDNPALPSSAAICGGKKSDGYIKSATDAGDTHGCLFGHVEDKWDDNGRERTYHKVDWMSHGAGETFISEWLKNA